MCIVLVAAARLSRIPTPLAHVPGAKDSVRKSSTCLAGRTKQEVLIVSTFECLFLSHVSVFVKVKITRAYIIANRDEKSKILAIQACLSETERVASYK